MSEYATGYQAHLAGACVSQFGGRPCRFDFSIFIPIVLQILTNLLSDCGGMNSPAALSDRLMRANSDWGVQYAVREAVRKANKEQGLKMNGEEQSITRQGLRNGFESMDSVERTSMCRAACMKAYGAIPSEFTEPTA